ncbi:MAG: STN domain-containing protein, partial [Acetobacter malorum]
MVIRHFLARGLMRGALGLSVSGVWTLYEGTGAKAQTTAPVHSFHVAPGALSEVLLAFSQQAHVQVTSDAESLDNRTSAGVTGHFTQAAGLQQILAGTGLTY